jgi:hypothetical protein
MMQLERRKPFHRRLMDETDGSDDWAAYLESYLLWDTPGVGAGAAVAYSTISEGARVPALSKGFA